MPIKVDLGVEYQCCRPESRNSDVAFSFKRFSNVLQKIWAPENMNEKSLVQLINAQGIPKSRKSNAPRKVRIATSSNFTNALNSLVDQLLPLVTKTLSERYKRAYRKSLKLVLLNLLASGFAHEDLALTTKISKNSHLDRLGLTRRHIERITDALSPDYLIKTRNGYLDHRSSKTNMAAQYYPTPLLMELGASLLYALEGDFSHDAYAPYQYKGEDRWDVNEETNIRIIREYNDFMSDHTWALKAPTVRKLGEVPYTSGRLYTDYQTIVNRRIHVRRNTLLDGQPLIECDFKSNHPFMLSYLVGKELPNNLYEELVSASGLDRPTVKMLVSAFIGAKKKHSLNEIKHANVGVIAFEKVDCALQQLERLCPWFSDEGLLFSDKGNRMQWLEGEIGLKMLKFAVDNGIALINIHDAYAVNHQHQQLVEEVMHRYRYEVLEEYKERFRS